MSFIKKLRLSKRLPSVLSKKSPQPNGLPAINATLNDSIVTTNNNTTLNTTITTTASSKSGKSKSNDSRSLIIYHIDSETEGTLSLTVRNDDNGETVLNKVCEHYSLGGYKEYFGLKYTLVDEKGDHEIFWLDPFKLVGKQLKDTNNVLTFRVKHFPGKPHLIDSEYVRYLIFLQIRNYLLKGDLQLSLADETRLAAYAVQAFLGDYDPDLHHDHYLTELKFLSPKSLKAEETIVELHKELRGKTPAEMELAFLEKVSRFDTYGAELIVVKNSKGVEINFGVSHNGIITYLHGMPSSVAKISLYPWTQIGKISYDGRTLKLHALTPDVKNPEIIKKQVMVFKCNSKRICKHLWKFILDQKSFFNFKRGVEVPKVKSSSSFFSHKSKFRFSGRCESELIASQYENSILNISPLSIATNGNDFKSNTLPSFRSSTMGTFKRRNFLNTHRSLAHSPTSVNQSTVPTLSNDPLLSPISSRPNDPNNNLLLKKVDENSADPGLLSPGRDQLDAHSISVQTSLSGSDQRQNLTSTPQSISIPKDNNVQDPMGTTTATSMVREDNHTDSEDDEFYDHDVVLPTAPGTSIITSSPLTNYSNLNKQFEAGHQSISMKPIVKKKRSIYFTITIIFIGFCLIMFIISVIQYVHCNLTTSNSIANNCQYSRIVSRLNDNFVAMNRRLLSYVPLLGGTVNANYRWISWPIYSPNSTNMIVDPLFSWFFSQYEP